MTIPKLTPYTGQVANPDGSQTQTEFTQNMFDQLSYEAQLATQLDATIDGMNNAVDEVEANSVSAQNSANAAEAAAASAGYQGLWPDTGGFAEKGDTWQTQVGGTPTGEYYTALQDTSVDPVGDNVNWKVNIGASNVRNPNLLSNGQFKIASPDGSLPAPSATPQDYPAGYQIFSGWFADDTHGASGVTRVNDILNWTQDGVSSIYTLAPKDGDLTEYTASLAEKVAGAITAPDTSHVSFSDNGDGNWRITIANSATDIYSCKFELGGVATGHEVIAGVKYAPSVNTRNWLQAGMINVGSLSDGVFSSFDDAVNEMQTYKRGLFFSGEWGINQPIIIQNGMNIKGDGINYSRIFANAGFTGSALMKTLDFDSLTGSGNWLRADGVVDGFSLKDFRIDGSTQNIKGTEFFAKRFNIEVMILNCLGGGWYSEAGSVTGQDDWYDMPESIVKYLSVRGCGGDSIGFFGSHDSILENLISRAGPAPIPGTVGVRIGAVSGVSSGNCDIGNIHVYGHESGVITDADTDQVKANLIISESIVNRAVTLNGSNAQISKMELYKNNTGGNVEAYNLLINGDRNTISNLRCNDTNGGGGLKITGDRNSVTMSIDGVGKSTSEGLVRNNGNGNALSGKIFNSTGVGLWTNPSAKQSNVYNLEIQNCDTIWKNEVQGNNNKYNITAELSSTQTLFDGVRPVRGKENVNLTALVSGGDDKKIPSFENGSGVVDLTKITQQQIDVPHNCPYQPYIENVSALLKRNSNVDDYAVDYIEIESTDATNVTVNVKLGAASSTPGAVADLLVQVNA